MLHAVGVSHARNGRELLSQASVQVRPGKLTALVGSNGAGKSTLLKVLAGHWDASAGEVRMAGVALVELSALELAKQRAMLAQENHVAFDFSVAEVVMMGRYPHHQGNPTHADQRACAHAMTLADCAAMHERRVSALSGGERARVQLARVLAQVLDAEPVRLNSPARYLLLDEPAAALDLAHQYQLFVLLQSLAHEHGLGVLVTVHDLNLAARFADDIVLLRAGRVTHAGTPSECLTASRLAEDFAVEAQVWQHPAGAPLIVPIRALNTQSAPARTTH